MARLGWADAARGLAIVTVVFFHVVLGLQDQEPVHWTSWALINIFGPFPIALFFVAAGRFSRTLVGSGWSTGVTRRIMGLAYVFGLWSVVCAASDAGLGDPTSIDVMAYLADPRSSLWFLWALIIYTALTAATPVRMRAVVTAISALAALCSFVGVISFDSFVYDNLLRFLPFFLMGIIGGDADARLERGRWPVLIAGGLLFAAATAAAYWGDLGEVGKGGLLFGLAAVAVPVGIAGASIVADVPAVGRVIMSFGRMSLGVYLVHPLVISLAMHQVAGAASGAWFVAPFAPFVVTLGVLAVSAGFVIVSQRLRWTWLYQPPGSARTTSPPEGDPAPTPRHRPRPLRS